MLGRVTLLCVALNILASAGKGSETHGSSAEESGEDDSSNSETGEKKAGVQHKFWIPTYEGTNPLNRRKIAITSSEIERYDRTIDVSLSGVYRNGTKQSRDNKGEDGFSMPMIWSGEDDNLNKSRKYDVTVESSGITLESESVSSLPSTDTTRNYSVKSGEKLAKRSNLTKHTTSINSKEKRKHINHEQTKSEKPKKKYVEKAMVSQFFDELEKAKSNETTNKAEYYKKIVKAATENTKRKLGYTKQKEKNQTNRKSIQRPEIIAVNIDSLEAPQKQDEIKFETSHDQLVKSEKLHTVKPQTVKPQNKVKPKSNDSNLISEEDSYAEFDMSSDSEQDVEDSFTEFCDYSAWSDVLCRNKTDRKGRKRKPKTKPISSTYLESREIEKPLGKKIKDKAEKLRQKEGKSSKKEKREREIRKKKSKKKKGQKQDYYDNEEDYPEKKLRMRTKGEKRYAIKEVKGYLQEMDKKYGGRPGRDNYPSRNERRGRDGEFGGSERQKGRDRKGGNRRQNKWDDTDYDDQRSYNRDNGRDRRERGMGRQRERYNDYRQSDYRRGREDSYRGRGGGRDFRGRGGGRDFRGRGGSRDFRGRGGGRDFRGRGGGRGFRGRGGGPRGKDRRDDYRSRGRSSGRGRGRD